MQKILIASLLIIGTTIGCSPTDTQKVQASQTPAITASPVVSVSPAPANGVAIGNPASQKCIADGGKLEIRKDASGGEYGVCIFPNGKECEEWQYFRGECKK